MMKDYKKYIQLVIPAIFIVGINLIFPLTFSALFIISTLAFLMSIMWKNQYSCWSIIVSSSIVVTLNYLRPSSDVYNNAAHNVIVLSGYERKGLLDLVNSKSPQKALFDNNEYIGDLSIDNVKDHLVLHENISSQPVYGYDQDNNAYCLLNRSNLIPFKKEVILTNGNSSLRLLFSINFAKRRFFQIKKDRAYLQCIVQSQTKHGTRNDTAAFNKVIKEGYPIVDIIRSAGVFSTEEEQLISFLKGGLVVRDKIQRTVSDVSASSLTWYLTIPSDLQRALQNSSCKVYADGKAYSFNSSPHDYQLEENSNLFIGCGLTKSKSVSFSRGEDDAIKMSFDMPVMFNFPDDTVSQRNKLAAISSSSDDLTSNVIKEVFFFNLFHSDNNVNNINGTILYQTGATQKDFSINILDANSDNDGIAIQKTNVSKHFNLSSKDRKGKWAISIVDLKKNSPVSGQSNKWTNEWLILGLIMLLSIIPFLFLFLFGDEDWRPTAKSRSLFHIWMFLVPLLTLRLYLLWRIAVFPPVSDISKSEFLRYRMENGQGLDNAMVLTIVCISIFFFLTLLYLAYYRYRHIFAKYDIKEKSYPIIVYTLLLLASILFAMTGKVIGNIAIPVLVFFVNEYLCLRKLSIPFRVVNAMVAIGLLVKGDPGYAIMFIIFVCIYYIIQTIVYRNSGTADGVQRNAAWRLALGLSILVCIIIIFSPVLVASLYSNHTMLGIRIPYYSFFIFGAMFAYGILKIIDINYGGIIARKWSAVAGIAVVAITIFGPNYLEENKHFKYRSLIHTQDVGQIMLNEDVSNRDNQRLLEASQNQWFLQHHHNLGESRITEDGILHLYPHFKKGVSWSTQISDVICSRYIIGELSFLVPIAIIAFVFVFFLFALRHQNHSSIGKSISYGIALLILVQTTFVWMANTNRMIFFGQDFPFMSQNAKATLLMFILLLFIMALACGNDYLEEDEQNDGLTESGFAYFNRRPVRLFLFIFIGVFGIVFFTGNKYSSLYGTRIATEYNTGEAMQQAERDMALINSILATYPAEQPLQPHGENLTKTIHINDIINSLGLDQAVTQMEANHDISPFSASLYRAFRKNLQNDNRIDNIIHLRYLSSTGSYVFGLNNGFYSLRAPEMRKNIWNGNIYAYEDFNDTDHLLTSSNRADKIDIYRVPNSWLKENGNFGVADVRFVDKDSQLTLHSSKNDYKISTGLFVINDEETIECRTGNNIYIDQLSGYKEKVLAKNMVVNGSNKFFYPMGKDFFWIKDFSEMAVSQKHGPQNCHLTIDKELLSAVSHKLNIIGHTCSVIALDGNGNVRLMAENNARDEYNLDPNDIATIENFVERSYLNPNYSQDSKAFGNQNLLYMLPGPGSSLKPITYAAVTSQVSPQIINWPSLKLHAPSSKYLSNGYYLMNVFGPEYKYPSKAPFKSISGDEIGINEWVDNKFYLYKSSNYYNALITYLGNYDKDDLGSFNIIVKPVSDFSNYPTFQINGINYCFKNAPSERRQNSVLNTGLSINFNMNVSYDDKDSTLFVSKEWSDGIIPSNHPWVFPASSNAFMREMKELDSEALRLKQYTLGSSPLRITPLMMAEMYGRLVSMHPDYHACITENDNKFTRNWDVPNNMDQASMFRFYQKELFSGMSLCASIGTARSQLAGVNTNGGSLHLYAKTGTLTLGNNIKDDRMLAVIISNKDIITAESPDSYKFYVVYFRFKQTGSMYRVSEILNDIMSSKSFVSYMNS